MRVETTRIFQHTMPKHTNTTTVFPSETTCPICRPTLRPLALAARLTCAVLLGAALPTHVIAQSTTSEVSATLPTATVVGRGETAQSPGKGFVAKQSSAGTKTDTPIIETPQSISVITQQQLEDQRPRGLSEALNYTSGAFTGLVGAANRYDYVALRGFNDASVNNALLDGLSLQGDQGSYSSFQIDPYFLQRIDVLKGPGSVLFGRASPGGVVSLVSKKPLFQPYHEVEFTVGNRNRVEGAFDISGPVDQNGVMAFRVTGLARGMDSQFQHVREQRFAIAPSLAINFTPNTHLLLQAYLQHDPEGSFNSGVPAEGSLFPRNGRTISRYFFDGDPTVEKFRRTERMVGYQFEHAFNDQWTVRQNFRYIFGDVRMRQIYGFGWADANNLTRYYAGAKEATHAYTVDNQLEGKFTTGPIKHTMLVGLDYQKRHVDGFWESGSADPINAFNPVYGNPGLTGVSAAPIDRWLEQTGVYLQDQIAIDRWRFTLGVREDHAKASNLYGTGTPSEWSGSKFTKRAGVVYLFDNGIAPYFSYADGFNPSLRADQRGNLLQPATAKQFEAGVRYQPKGSSTMLSAAVFNLEQENVASKPVSQIYYVPTGKIRTRGLELEARSQVTDTVSVLANYTFTDMKFVESAEGFTGNTPYQAPRHMASVWGDWTFMPGYTAGVGVRYVGTSYGDNANSFKVPPYTLVDLMLRIDLARWDPSLKGAKLQLSAKNIFNKTYVASCMNSNYCYWGDARNVMATISYQW